MPVEAQLDRIREIGPEFEKGGSPLRVLHVEVVMIDGDRLAREVEGDAALRARTLVRLERAHLLLRHADHDHPVVHRPARAIVGDHVVFALAALERDQRHVLRGRVGLDGADEAVQHRRKQRGRRDRMAQVIPKEVAQPTRRLQLGHVGVQVQPVETPNGQGHVVANKLVDVGHRRLLLAKKSPDATPRGVRRGLRRRRQRFITSEAAPQTNHSLYSTV